MTLVEKAAMAASDAMTASGYFARVRDGLASRDETREAWMGAIVAALKAMREPTESMLDAGEVAFSVPDAIGAGDAWQAMIDQAIKEGGG